MIEYGSSARTTDEEKTKGEYIFEDCSLKKRARLMWNMTSTCVMIRAGRTVTWNMMKTRFCSEERELSRFKYIRPVTEKKLAKVV
jgi:hypothetical protein